MAAPNENTAPTISVIIPVYNGENYLREAIDSVRNQTFQDLELIVVDDGSTDSTAAIVQAYGTLVKYVLQNNQGTAAAFNHGLRLARGKYISWLSHDDVYAKNKLELQLDVLSHLDSPGACYTDVQVIDGCGKLLYQQTIPDFGRQVLAQIVTAGLIMGANASMFYDRRCIEQVGMYDPSRRYSQDIDMLIRLARKFPLIRVPHFLIQVREHPARGTAVYADGFAREHVEYHRYWLDKLPLAELFPDHRPNATPSERAEMHRWLGDRLSARPAPVCWVAAQEYRKAMRADPLRTPFFSAKLAKLYWRRLRSTAK